jgi:hypothetical protein
MIMKLYRSVSRIQGRWWKWLVMAIASCVAESCHVSQNSCSIVQSQHFSGPNMQSFQFAMRAAAKVPNDRFQSLQESGKFTQLPEYMY